MKREQGGYQPESDRELRAEELVPPKGDTAVESPQPIPDLHLRLTFSDAIELLVFCRVAAGVVGFECAVADKVKVMIR